MRSVFLTAAALLALFSVVHPVEAGLGPENVAVIVNAGSHSSRTVANAFVHGRGIPVDNVIYLSDVPGFEHIDVDDFRDRLLKPVLKTIEDRGLTPQIDCIAWSSDFPYAVDVQSDIAAAGLKLPQVLTPTASINGLTFLYELVLAKDPRYLELNANWYYRKTFRKGRKPQDVKPPTDDERTRFRDAMKLVQEKKWDKAAEALAELAKSRPEEAPLHYNLACAMAQTQKPDEAMKALATAVEAGWSDRAHVEKDEDLKSLRERDDFKALLSKIIPPRFEVEPTVGFRSSYRWNERGERVEEAGRRYLLSVMLAVTSGRGTSIDNAVRNFHPIHPAERHTDLEKGTFYFLKNGDVRARTREWAFDSVAVQLREMGLKAEVIEGTIPQNKSDVAGAVVGIADFDWAKSGSQILDDAIVEHLTSFGGVMREHSGQTPLTEFLKAGAAGASGTVTEPYAIQAKFPTAFLHLHYARGATLAEAFYLSVQGPYQLLIVGDPLRQPFQRAATFELDAIQEGTVPKIVPPLKPIAVGDSPLTGRFEFFVDGKRAGQCIAGESWKLESERLSPGRHLVTMQRVSADPLEVRGRYQWPWPLVIDIGNADQTTRFEPYPTHEDPFVSLLRTPRRQRMAKATELLRQRITCSGATAIVLRIQGEPVAEVAGSDASVGVPLAGLGEGRMKFDAVATTPDGIVKSGPIPFKVDGVVVNCPQESSLAEKALTDGLLLSASGHEPAVIADTRDVNWLASHKFAAGTLFSLEGIFAVDFPHRTAVFQTSGNCAESMEVDGRRLSAVQPGPWRDFPFRAERGRHRVIIRGQIPSDGSVSPQLSIRYGVEGTQSLDGKRFQHEIE
jgi:hypothetical protein